MRRSVALVLLAAALAGCDRGGSHASGGVSSSGNGLSLTVGFDKPLRTGRPVTWTLELANRGKGPVDLRFSSGKEGDVVLLRGNTEVYRWSANRLFSQALREMSLAAGHSHTFKLEERALGVPAGDYEVVAQLDSEPAPGPVRRSAEVQSG